MKPGRERVMESPGESGSEEVRESVKVAGWPATGGSIACMMRKRENMRVGTGKRRRKSKRKKRRVIYSWELRD